MCKDEFLAEAWVGLSLNILHAMCSGFLLVVYKYAPLDGSTMKHGWHKS